MWEDAEAVLLVYSGFERGRTWRKWYGMQDGGAVS